MSRDGQRHPRGHHGRRRRGVGVMVLGAALVATTLETAPAGARSAAPVADEPGEVQLITSQPVEIDGVTQTETTLAFDIATSQADLDVGTVPLTPQCVTTLPPATGLTQTAAVCVGEASQHLSGYGGTTIPDVEIRGVDDIVVNPQAPHLGWLQEEAVDALMTVHGVTDRDIMLSYGRPAMRAYMLTRLLDILDKKLYGVPMTAEEAQTYDAMMTFLQKRELGRAKAAVREYERWEADPCGYDVPAPPSAELPPYHNTAHTAARCGRVSQLVQAFQFTKATPPTTTFEAWGAYRTASPLMRNLSHPAVKQSLVNTNAGYAVLGALGAATLAGVGAGIGVAASTALTNAVIAATQVGTYAIANSAISSAALASVGGGLAGFVVGSVVLGLVIAAVSIWMIVEEEKIPAALRQRVDQAAQHTDPLGIAAMAPAYAGLDYATKEHPAESAARPLHHQAEFTSQLQGLVAEWTMFDPQGNLVPDPETGHDDKLPTPADIWFRRVADGQLTSRVPVRADDRTVTGTEVRSNLVSFSRGWLMVAPSAGPAWGVAKPRTYVRFIDAEGLPAYMSIAHVDPDSEGPAPPRRMFVVTPLAAPGEERAEPFLTDTWEVSTGGGTAAYTLEENPVLSAPISVVPTLEGTLLPGHPVELRAHHNLTSGSGTYTWQVDRLAADGSVVETETHDSVAFVDEFTDPGDYRATVRFQGTSLGQPFDVSGEIDFTVDVPRPRIVRADLVDQRLSHDGRLFLDLELEQSTAGETFDVEVEWADDNRGNRIVRHYTVRCAGIGTEPVCRTGPLSTPSHEPVNDNWSESPVFAVPEDQSFLPFVTMTVTNSRGATVEQAFRIDGEHRARYADRTPYVRMEVGKFSRVPITTVTPSETLPGATIGFDNALIEEVATQLPAGMTPEVAEDPDSPGRYVLYVRGEPQTADLGLYSFYFPVDQRVDGVPVEASRPPPAQVVLDIVPSVEPGFRAILSNVPTGSETILVRGDDPPPWAVQVPYVTPEGADPATDPAYEGEVTCTLTKDGQPFVQEPCAVDEPFPWPADLEDADYEASVVAGPSGDATVNDTVYARRFTVRRIRPELTYRPSWPDAATDTVRLTIEDLVHDPARGRVDPPFSAAGYQVTCRLDQARTFTPCLDGGVLRVPRTPGEHRLVVRVVDADDGTVVLEPFDWTVGAAPATFVVSAPSTPQLAGAPVRVRARGLLPEEDYVIRIGGQDVASGFAAPDGTVTRSVVVPAGLAEGRHQVRVVGEGPGRAGQQALTVVRARTLGVAVRDRVARGGQQRVVVRGLVAGERVTLTYAGRRVGPVTADREGVAVLMFGVGRSVGEKVVRVTGAYASRRGAATFRVVR